MTVTVYLSLINTYPLLILILTLESLSPQPEEGGKTLLHSAKFILNACSLSRYCWPGFQRTPCGTTPLKAAPSGTKAPGLAAMPSRWLTVSIAWDYTERYIKEKTVDGETVEDVVHTNSGSADRFLMSLYVH